MSSEFVERVVIDTDILIDHLRGFLPARVFLNLIYDKKMTAFISTVTVMELLSGKSALEENRRIKIERLLSLFTPVDATYVIAQKAGELRRRFGVNPIDSLIAATALILNCKLITCNISHYKIIPELNIYKPYDK
jgi:tRNA(fMet)-specific endonuclease VapC